MLFDKKKIIILFFLFHSLLFISIANSQHTVTADNSESLQFVSSNLPIIIINTHGKNIPNNIKIIVDMGIIYNGEGVRNYLTDPFNDYDGKINIEIRGSSSTLFPKKQYAFETQDSLGNNYNVSLLGLPSENDWILFAPYSDKTLMRNVLVYKLANDMGYYASRTRFCELILNDEYFGVYVVMEKIKRDKNRVAISRLNPDEISGDAVTGGYIIKIDKTDGEEIGGWFSTYPPFPEARQKIFYQYHYPKPDEIVPEQKQYIQNFISHFEDIMASSSYANPIFGYPKIIATNSFADHLIVNELSKNVDGYRLSSFMYKDRDSIDSKLYMGPLWDFNLGFGNADYYDGASYEGWEIEYLTEDNSFKRNDGFQAPFWWKKFWGDSLFQTMIRKRWSEFSITLFNPNYFIQKIDSLALYLKEAQKRNFEKWPILNRYVWPNPYIGGTYQNEINHLKAWIAFRIQWMNDNLPIDPVQSIPAQTNLIPKFFFIESYPNPFREFVTIKYNLFENAHIKIFIFDMMGRKINELTDQFHQTGIHAIVWDGKNQSAQPAPNGVYFCRIDVRSARIVKSFTQKLILLR